MIHKNPYRINDPNDIFEVGENSSHPEINDRERVWHYKGYTFHKATELERYLDDHGIDKKTLWIHPVSELDGWSGKNIIRIYVAEKRPKDVANEMLPYEDTYGRYSRSS